MINRLRGSLTFLFVVFVQSNLAHSLDLKSALQRVNANDAYLNSAQRVFLKESQSDEIQSSLFPSLSLKGRFTRQDQGTSYSKKQQESLTLTFLQPLYRHFKEWKALEVADQQLEAEQNLKEATSREISQFIVVAYFELLSSEQEIQHMEELLLLSKEREKDLRSRVSIGKSKKSDLLSAQAQTLNVQGQLDGVKSGRNKAASRLERLIQVQLGEKGSLREPKMVVPPNFKSPLWEQYPALKAARILEQAAKRQISISRADYFPALDLEGNYYLHQSGSFNQRDWDASLVLSFPLFEGGKTVSAVQSSSIRWQQSVLDSFRVQRDFKEKISLIYSDYQFGDERLKLLEKAVQVNFRNYQELQREYRLGLVTNLDVISALNQYIEEKKEFTHVKNSVLSAGYQLLTLSGGTL